MTDFFERQNIAKRKTQILLCYFIPAVVATMGALYMFFAIVLNLNHHSPKLALGVCELSLIVIIGGSLVKIWSLQQGGSSIATMLGGGAVPLQPQDPDEKKFRDVVEEMSIASGVPVPQLFILPRENSINAFAAGHTTSDAAIVATRGALKLLTRDELQGVVAHEFSHICNGDMSLNLWVIGLVHGILCIALLGKFAMRVAWEGDFDRATPIMIAIGAVIFVIGIIGYFFGSLIKCAVSRQREYLADAAAVQFTRNPLGLAGALKKIGGLREGGDIIAADADEISHLFFADANTGWFSTHPPIADRIQLLDPTFDGKFPMVKALDEDPALMRTPPTYVANSALTQAVIKPQRRGPQHLVYAAGLTASLPIEISNAAHEPFSACALIYSMLLLPDDDARAKQLSEITTNVEPGLLTTAQQLFPTVCALSSGQKLAVISIAMPALRQMSASQYDNFSRTVKLLVESDSEISLFEYGLQKSLLRYLEPRFKSANPPIAQYYAAAGLGPECAVLFSALAYESSDNDSEISRAFQCGAQQLDLPPAKQINLLSREDCNLAQVDAAIAKISQAALPVKREIINACALVVASDSLVKEEEAEMLRAIADAMGCPLPPFVSAIAIAEAA